MYVYQGRSIVGSLSIYQYDNFIFHTYPHVHNEVELVFLENGSLVATIDGDKVTASAGNCIMILPHQIHYYESTQVTKSVVISFTIELLPVFQSQIGNNVTDKNVFPLDDIASLCFRRYFIEHNQQNIFEQVTALYSVCNCLLKIANIVPRKYPEHAPAYRVIQYIAEHYLEDISMHSAAVALGYEYHYLSRMFNQTTNASFRDFLNYHRIEYARSMLRSSKESITQIALIAGFRSIRSFNRIFLEITGYTPREYRNL